MAPAQRLTGEQRFQRHEVTRHLLCPAFYMDFYRLGRCLPQSFLDGLLQSSAALDPNPNDTILNSYQFQTRAARTKGGIMQRLHYTSFEVHGMKIVQQKDAARLRISRQRIYDSRATFPTVDDFQH